MKKIKKLLAVLMTLAMVMGMSMTTMAANATVSVKLPTGSTGGNTTVTYDQIVVEDRESTLGWKFADEYKTDFIKAFLNVTEDTYVVTEADEDIVIAALIKLGTLEDVNNFVEYGNINTDADDVNTLATGANLGRALDAVDELFDGEATVEGEKASFTVSTDNIGLYGISVDRDGYTFIPMSVYVGTGFAGIEATAKGSKDEITKDIDNEDDQSVSAGDKVAYTATTPYPFYSDNEIDKEFYVTDRLTNATYVKSTVKVYLDDDKDGVIEENETKLSEDIDYTITFGVEEGDTCTDKFVINFNYNATHAGKTVVIKYDVMVGEGAAAVSNSISSNFDATEDSVTLDKVEVKVIKEDEDKNKLADATFAIYELSETPEKGFVLYKDVTIVNGETTTIGDLYLKEITTETTDADGEATFEGLDAQKTYYIKETVAPKGYSLNDNYYQINPTTSEDTDNNEKTYEFADFADTTVVDTKLSALPSTGGIGTTIFTIAGCGIMIVAAYLFFVNKKKES